MAMKFLKLPFILLFIFSLSTVAACHKETCPTYATSGPSKKSKKNKKKNAPWHKSNTMKKGKKGNGVSPQ